MVFLGRWRKKKFNMVPLILFFTGPSPPTEFFFWQSRWYEGGGWWVIPKCSKNGKQHSIVHQQWFFFSDGKQKKKIQKNLLVKPPVWICSLIKPVRPWHKSPTIATVFSWMLDNFCLMVCKSSNACVGCSPVPSPAFTIGTLDLSAARWAAPESGCRRTTKSVYWWQRVMMVSAKKCSTKKLRDKQN